MRNVFAKFGEDNILNPRFEGHSFVAQEPMFISYEKIDPETGAITIEEMQVAIGDEVPIGDFQNHQLRASLYKKQGAMVDHIESKVLLNLGTCLWYLVKM